MTINQIILINIMLTILLIMILTLYVRIGTMNKDEMHTIVILIMIIHTDLQTSLIFIKIKSCTVVPTLDLVDVWIVSLCTRRLPVFYDKLVER